MSKIIPLSKLSNAWFKDPDLVREYEALEEEFTLATTLIKARPSTTTLAEVAKTMGTRLRVSFEAVAR